MKIRNRHIVVSLILAGVFSAGCSQQQTATAMPVVDVTPEPPPVVDYVPEPVVEPAPIPVARPAPPPVQTVRPVPQRPPVKVVVPQVKAKGNYRGAVQIDRSAVQQYQY